MFPATAGIVSVSVVSDVGTTMLSYAMLRSGVAAVHFQSLYASTFCGTNNSRAIPLTSPPLCQLQVLVSTPTNAIYRITATTSSDQSQSLTAGEPATWQVTTDQSACYTFSVPDNLSNVTIIVTVTNGANGLVLRAGRIEYGRITPQWNVTQPSDSDVLVFQFDWNDPRLPVANQPRGEYAFMLSATSDPVAFSVVYTIANSSVYGSTIVELRMDSLR